MKYVENGVPEDFAKLTFEGLNVPLCELSQEEYMWVVFGIRDYVPKNKHGVFLQLPAVQEPEHTYYEESVDILDLTVRAEHCLQRAGIETIGQLCALTEWQLSKLRNMGAKSVKEVKEKLAKINCKLKKNSNGE